METVGSEVIVSIVVIITNQDLIMSSVHVSYYSCRFRRVLPNFEEAVLSSPKPPRSNADNAIKLCS